MNNPIAPKHLQSIEAICTEFKKTRRTVKQSIKKGAPIAYDGRSYCSEYNRLMDWLIRQTTQQNR